MVRLEHHDDIVKAALQGVTSLTSAVAGIVASVNSSRALDHLADVVKPTLGDF